MTDQQHRPPPVRTINPTETSAEKIGRFAWEHLGIADIHDYRGEDPSDLHPRSAIRAALIAAYVEGKTDGAFERVGRLLDERRIVDAALAGNAQIVAARQASQMIDMIYGTTGGDR